MKTRFGFHQIVLALTCTMCLLANHLFAVTVVAQSAATATASAAKPNVLFLAVDDLNVWIGAYGKRADVKTPNFDRLAKRGVVFNRAYCTAPSCNPSRTAILTGVRPSTSGVYDNEHPWRPVMPDVVTLPQHFTANGYDVVGGGKVFHNSYNDLASWSEYYEGSKEIMPAKRPVNGIKGGNLDWGPLPLTRDDEMSDYKVVSWGINCQGSQHRGLFSN